MEILYEDNHLIAVNKNCHELVQGDKSGDVSLIEMLKDYLKTKYNKPGNVFLGSPHRIDRPATGVVLFAKTSKMLTRMCDLFQHKDEQIDKIYWAIVKNRPPQNQGRLEHFLKKNEQQNKSYVVVANEADKYIKKAILEYLKYGFARSNADGSICLHARQISFIHPVSKQPICIVAPTPQDNLWQAFTEKVASTTQ